MCLQTEKLVTSNAFHRRKIESNWEKYEETECTETADFSAPEYGELLEATRMFAYMWCL